jgi:DNA-3-methyladenine glycosylase
MDHVQTMSARKVMPLSYFRNPASEVARGLVGQMLVRAVDSKLRRYVITETEAYLGVHDLASHSSKGRTVRTEIMFGPAGRFYIYRIYGLHWMLNIVTNEVDEAAAVLIRGVEGFSGPGRVTAGLQIDSSLQGHLANRGSGLWFEFASDPEPVRIMRTPRINIDYAGPFWAKQKLRFIRAK